MSRNGWVVRDRQHVDVAIALLRADPLRYLPQSRMTAAPKVELLADDVAMVLDALPSDADTQAAPAGDPPRLRPVFGRQAAGFR